MVWDISKAQKFVFSRLAPLLVVLVLTPACLFPQTKVSSDGTDFVFALFPIANNPSTIYGPVGYDLQVACYDTATISLYSFNSTGKEILEWSVFVDSTKALVKNISGNEIVQGAPPSYQAFHLTSTSPVSVQLLTEGNDNGELYLLLPTLGLGTLYVAESYPNAPMQPAKINSTEWNALLGRSMVVVAAPYDSTHIAFTPSCRTANGVPQGVKQTVLLRRGQVYMIEADTSSNADISGTLIASDKPISVFSGNNDPLLPDLRSVPLGVPSDNFRNPVIETMLPVACWDTTGYVSIPFYSSGSGQPLGGIGDLYRCSAYQQLSAAFTELNSTKTVNTDPNETSPVSISSLNGTLLSPMQYDYFSGSDLTGYLETFTTPDATVLIPRSAWKNRYAWVVPFNSQYNGGEFVNIIGPASRIYRLTLLRSGTPINYTPIAAYTIPQYPSLRGITVQLPGGEYELSSDSNFIVYSYGRTKGASKFGYGYAAPCGLILSVPSNILPTITVHTSCGTWHVHIHDVRVSYMRMTSLKWYSDSAAAALHGFEASKNISSPYPSPNFADSDINFDVSVVDLTAPANGYIYLQDGLGAIHPIHLMYQGFAPGYSPHSLAIRIADSTDTCHTIKVWNPDSSSSIPIMAARLGISSIFALDTNGLSLPRLLAAHDTISFQVCANVPDHDTLHYDTLFLATNCDLRIPLSITGLLPRVNWDRDSATDTLLCGQPDTVRVWLQNNSATHSTEIIDSIVIAGPDASEFHIAANQFDYPQLVDFPMYYGEKAWIDIAFVPDMTKPLPLRWADRHASIVAYNSLHSNPVIALTAHVTYGKIDVASSEVDLGQIIIKNSKSATINLTNDGTAAVTISQITTSDTQVSLSGLTPGDVLQPGETVPVQVTATAFEPDSTRVLIQIWTNSVCTSPDTIYVTFVGQARGVESVLQPAVFAPVFTCSQTFGVATITDLGPDTMRILALRIFGTPANPDTTDFTFANGTHAEVLDTTIEVDSSFAITIKYHPQSQGLCTANLEIEWDSLGTTVFTHLTVAAVSTMLHSTLSASVNGTDTTYPEVIANSFGIPIVLNAAPDPLAQVLRLPITLSFASDLYEYNGIDPAPGLTIKDSSVTQVQGRTIVSLTIASQNPIIASEKLFTVNLLPVLAIANTDTLTLASDMAIGSANDTLCLHASLHIATIFVADSCGGNELRNVMQGKPPFRIESVVPNPAQTSIRVVVADRGDPGGLAYQLFDALGRTRLAGVFTGTTAILAVTSCPPGCYYLRLSTNGYAQTRTLAIQR